MMKVLLAILILIIGGKIITNSGSLANKISITKLSEEDEESKKEKEDNKQNKRSNEEAYYSYNPVELFAMVTAKITSSSRKQKPYHRFLEKPNTPPPDFA